MAVNLIDSITDKLRDCADLKTAVAGVLTPERYQHSLGTADLAAELAERYNYPDLATVGRVALLHDLGKGFSSADIAAIRDWRGWEPDEAELAAGPSLLHAPVGAAIAAALRTPEQGAAAIRYHVTGRPALTTIDKIIMAADAAETNRAYAWAQEMRYVLGASLDLAVAFWMYLKEGLVRLGGGVVHPRSSLALASLDPTLLNEAALLAKPYLD